MIRSLSALVFLAFVFVPVTSAQGVKSEAIIVVMPDGQQMKIITLPSGTKIEVMSVFVKLPDGRLIDSSPGFVPASSAKHANLSAIRPSGGRLQPESKDGVIMKEPQKAIIRPEAKRLQPATDGVVVTDPLPPLVRPAEKRLQPETTEGVVIEPKLPALFRPSGKRLQPETKEAAESRPQQPASK